MMLDIIFFVSGVIMGIAAYRFVQWAYRFDVVEFLKESDKE